MATTPPTENQKQALGKALNAIASGIMKGQKPEKIIAAAIAQTTDIEDRQYLMRTRKPHTRARVSHGGDMGWFRCSGATFNTIYMGGNPPDIAFNFLTIPNINPQFITHIRRNARHGGAFHLSIQPAPIIRAWRNNLHTN